VLLDRLPLGFDSCTMRLSLSPRPSLAPPTVSPSIFVLEEGVRGETGIFSLVKELPLVSRLNVVVCFLVDPFGEGSSEVWPCPVPPPLLNSPIVEDCFIKEGVAGSG